MALRRRVAGRVTPRSTHTEWWWPPPPTIYRTVPAGYRSFEQVVYPEIDPGPAGAYLWAYEFKFVGGEAGYIGLQTDGAPEGRSALFAVSNGRDMAATQRTPFPWVTGGAYRLRVWTDDGGWWFGAVRDEYSGIEAPIGNFQTPPGWLRLASWSMTTVEYRGRVLSRCADLRPVQVSFSVPTADDGTVEPQVHQSRVGEGTCEGASVEDVPGGVRHAIGLA